MKKVETVAGVIYNSSSQILCAQRDEGKYKYVSFKWEFPGGKIEQGEDDCQALTRELFEELEMEVDIQDKFFQVEHDYPDFHLSMAVYTCKLKSENIKINVHKQIKWVGKKDLLDLDWADADFPVVQKILKVD